MRRGDLSGMPAIYDPLSTAVDGQRVAFQGNRIPSNLLDRVAQAFLVNIPLPNRPGTTQNLIASEKEVTDMDQFNARFDHHFSAADTFFARFSIFDVNTFQPFGASQLNETLIPGFGRNTGTRPITLR
jgi:hypothetical protein